MEHRLERLVVAVRLRLGFVPAGSDAALDRAAHDEEAEVDRFEGFEGWTDTLIQQILAKRNLSNLDEDEKWEMLSRHYLEMTGDELTLVVLPEK